MSDVDFLSEKAKIILQSHTIRANAVRERLLAAENGQHLTAQEMIEGVRIPLEEYVYLIDLLQSTYRAAR